MKLFKAFTVRFWVLSVIALFIVSVSVGAVRAVTTNGDVGEAVAVEFIRTAFVEEIGDVDGTGSGSIGEKGYRALYRAIVITDKGERIPVLMPHCNVQLMRPLPVLVVKIRDGQSGQYFYYAPLPLAK